MEQDEKKEQNADIEKESGTDTLLTERPANIPADSPEGQGIEPDAVAKEESTEELYNEAEEILAENLPEEDASVSDTTAQDTVANNAEQETLPADQEETEQPQEDTEEPENQETIGRRIIKNVIYAVLIVAVSALLAGSILYCYTDYIGLFRADKTVQVTIPRGASTGRIASVLKDDGVIRSPLAFNLYVALSKKTGMHAGKYTFSTQLSYAQIVSKLQSGDILRAVTVTIPEGYTMLKIADLLDKNKVCTKADFIKAANSADVDFDFQSAIPKDPNRLYRLEGYLFPDTYQFYQSQPAKNIVKKMVENFDRRFNADLRNQAKSAGMTVDQAVTLASIIQKEAGGAEMSKVSSVFHNRLKNGVYGKKLLQSDATVRYVKYVVDLADVSNTAQKAEAYSTYKHEGLPPGAICNPGLDAIKAALNPAKTSYYYFVSDSAGRYYYAKTYKKHRANVKIARKVGGAKGTNVTK